jgi:hypothetical protein
MMISRVQSLVSDLAKQGNKYESTHVAALLPLVKGYRASAR